MMILSLLFFVSNPTVPIYEIGKIVARVSSYGNHSILRPKAMTKMDDILAVFDQDYQVWILSASGEIRSVFGKKGAGPGEFSKFLQLYLETERVGVLHQRGSYGRLERFTLDGEYLDLRRTGTSIYVRGQETIGFRRIDKNVFSPIEVVWELDGKKVIISLGDHQDRAFSSKYKIVRCGNFTLIFSGHSIKRTIYYLLLDSQKGLIWDKGQIRLVDGRASLPKRHILKSMGPNASMPVVEGCTSSKEIGFVINEQAKSQDYRILRILDPQKRSWNAIRVNFGPQFTDLFFFQHIQGTLWAAYSESEELVFFHLQQID